MKAVLRAQKLWIWIVLITVVLLLGRNLSPFSKTMFTFHDETQAARIQQFTLNIQTGHIPPRIAPEFSYGMGYPVFNFYAPFAYYVSSFLNILGLSVIASLKTSFLLALIGAFLGMYLLLKELFEESSAIFGATLYVTSAFIPVEIFVRGNLSEMWFLALFPLTLFLLIKNSKQASKTIFFFSVLILSFLFTVHNIFSLLSFLIIPAFMSILPNKKRNFMVFGFAALLASYFIIPALGESGLTYASIIATKTNFADHFLCVKQLWSGQWGFGGSVPGCTLDGMSFALGKPQIIFGFLGMTILFVSIMRTRSLDSLRSLGMTVTIAVLTVLSLFLTLYQSQFIWNLLFPIFSLFQFPWRFLVFAIFGLSFLGAYTFYSISPLLSSSSRYLLSPLSPYLLLFSSFLSIGLILSVSPFFTGQSMSNTLYESKYLSDTYIRNEVAYKIPEYLPKTADYTIWRSFENTNTVPYSEGLFEKETLNYHYFPFWHIQINGIKVILTKFDTLGRPLINVPHGSKIIVTYQQTTIEQLSNVVTIVALLTLLSLLFYKPLWMKIQKIEN